MTALAGRPAGPPALEATDPLTRCLATGDELLDASGGLGLRTERLATVIGDARRRLGFPGDAWVLALVGGTGVGKSTLLNRLAGTDVSRASVLRPTTSEPVAWVPSTQREELRPLLDWLGVPVVREHPVEDLGPVAILDLPDMDSVAEAHRERVEAILPRVDAVAWVTDPEKYHDAVLHDAFLRTWLPRLARQAIVLNKADRLDHGDARRIVRELEADAVDAAGRRARVPVLLTAAGEGTIEEVRAWIAAGVEAKAIVRAQAAKGLASAAAELLREAGLGPDRPPTPLLDDERRRGAINDATNALLEAIDIDGLARQAVAATRASARRSGAGPVGLLPSLVSRASGRETQVADPNGFLLRWREHGSTTPAVEAVRAALAEPLRAAPPAVRPTVAQAMDPAVLRPGLERGVDRAGNGTGALQPPRSRWWRFLGLLQLLVTAGLVLSAAWVVVWILVRPETGSVDVPVIGPVPTPFASLVAFIAAGYLLARL